MKLVTYRSAGSGRPGALLGSGDILDLRRAVSSDDAEPLWNIATLLAQGEAALKHAATVVAAVEKDPSDALMRGWVISAGAVQLLGPTGHNPMLWTAGPLYREHLEEMGVADTDNPSISMALRNANSIIGAGQAIELPSVAPDMVDWEGEFAVVIGSPTYQVQASEALNHVVGYTIYNDVSARDHTEPWVKEMNQPGGSSARYATLNLLYKEFPTFSPLGPCIVTADELDLESLVLTTTVNGEPVQEFKVTDTTVPIAEAIAYVSQRCLLMPGDVVSIGTSTGVGYAMKPQRFLRPGDEVSITVAGIGTLRNPVITGE